MSGVMGGIELPKSLISMDFQDRGCAAMFSACWRLNQGLNVIYGSDVTGTISIHLDQQVHFDQAFQTVLTLKGLVALMPMGLRRVVRVVTSTRADDGANAGGDIYARLSSELRRCGR